MINTLLILIGLVLILDLLLATLSKRGKLHKPYISGFMTSLKQTIRYGEPWDSIRITQIFDMVYFNALLLSGFSYLESSGHHPNSLIFYVLIPGAAVLICIWAVQWKVSEKVSMNYFSTLIHASFITVGFVGCSLFLHDRFGYTTEIMFLYLFVIPVTNTIYRKGQLTERAQASKKITERVE